MNISFHLLLSWVALLPAVVAIKYPVGITNCGISSWLSEAPKRAISMNQGTTEILLALGLADRTIGTAYLDDEIWQELAEDYAKVPVLSDSYPEAQQIQELQPDFLYASYSSAFATSHVNYTGHFDSFDECQLVIERSDGQNRSHCRQELHDAGIQTYLQAPFCEEVTQRPEALTLNVLLDEIWEIATIFDALDQARSLIDTIQNHFDQAQQIVAGQEEGTATPPIRVLWLDSINKEGLPFVGVCCGAVQIILENAGAENVFASVGVEERSSWGVVSWEEVAEADPDLIVVVDAAWDSIEEKLFNLCSNSTRELRAVQNRAFLTVPFSASTLGVRIGALAYNLAEAMAALTRGAPLPSLEFSQVATITGGGGGSQAVTRSGVKVYTTLPEYEGINLNTFCPGAPPNLVIVEDGAPVAEGTSDKGLEGWAVGLIATFGVLAAGITFFLFVVISREKKGQPMFVPDEEVEVKDMD